MPLVVTADGPRGAAEVWHDYTHPPNWSEWAPQIRSVEGLGEEISAGARGVVRGVGGLAVPVRILQVDHERYRWSWLVGPGIRMSHTVESIDGGSRASMTLHAPVALVWPYRPVARKALRALEAG